MPTVSPHLLRSMIQGILAGTARSPPRKTISAFASAVRRWEDAEEHLTINQINVFYMLSESPSITYTVSLSVLHRSYSYSYSFKEPIKGTYFHLFLKGTLLQRWVSEWGLGAAQKLLHEEEREEAEEKSQEESRWWWKGRWRQWRWWGREGRLHWQAKVPQGGGSGLKTCSNIVLCRSHFY